MIQYILESIAFQLLFLVVYDFYLKKETFFQWNRLYLLGTFVLSLILPWVKIEAFKQQVPQTFAPYPEYLWKLQNEAVVAQVQESSGWNITWQEGILYGGMLVAMVFFGLKIRQLYLLRKSGEKVTYPLFTQIVITNSNIAFSFLKSIFIGDKVLKMKHDTIIAHELVHIKQGHTYDLLFFEFMRVIGWFNPLVYVYQNRISELHEFIADAQVSKEHKTDHYEQLLAQVFQTEHISFINQFFTKSLIKKRIVMLQKSKSKKVWQLKYLLLVPMVLGMLLYTSCEIDKNTSDSQESTKSDELLIAEVKADIAENKLSANYLDTSGLALKYHNPEEIITKYDFFKYELLVHEILENSLRENENGELNNLVISLPSTKRYDDFVIKKEAYKIIDSNVKILIKEHRKDISYRDNYYHTNSTDNHVFKVNDITKLTTNELKDFEEMLSRLRNKTNDKQFMALVDSNYAFEIYTKVYTKALGVKYQSKLDKMDISFAEVDEVPIFPGCEDADDKRACFNKKIQKHISKHFNYPQAAQDANIEGRVNTMFMISSEGTIENIKMRGTDKLLENEVERIIKRLPQMTPGKQSGKAVNVPYSIPVQFKLQ
ncbi:M56 family metallopeptidase [uncultured Maribacter sp.]|uniref:M56 family metallopeptidase n=1 Tax=uncultured Maribacter sp. TaxID=431308 RepID=UPI00262CC3AE|nr:M56 family metallopeptidase [uncultured Maribacter sp.]